MPVCRSVIQRAVANQPERFYQDNGDDADLLRLMLTLDSSFIRKFPAIRAVLPFAFMPLDSENGLVPGVLILNWLLLR